MFGKEMGHRGGHRWAQCLHTGRCCHCCLQQHPTGSSCCKSPFFLPGTGTAHQHPFGCKARGCTYGLVLLLGHLWRKKGPEMGIKKAFGKPRGETWLGLGTGNGAPHHTPANH